MGKKILIMGLPGAGKTTLASKLKLKINSDWINADQIRKDYNDLDFSTEGRIRQSLRMKKISNEITNTGKNVKSILDFLEISDVNLDELLVKLKLNHDKIKNNNLEKNLKKFVKPQTFNKSSEEIRKKLVISDIENFITENLPK